jgi:hypothetical protein
LLRPLFFGRFPAILFAVCNHLGDPPWVRPRSCNLRRYSCFTPMFRGSPNGLPECCSHPTRFEVHRSGVNGVLIACLYLPNGNPQPGPKFTYKLAWFERLIGHAAGLMSSGVPVVLAGDYNVVPTPQDIYPTRSPDNNALIQPESRRAFQRLLRVKAGPTLCGGCTRKGRSGHFGITNTTAGRPTRECGSITSCSRLRCPGGLFRAVSTDGSAGRKMPAITPPRGWTLSRAGSSACGPAFQRVRWTLDIFP